MKYNAFITVFVMLFLCGLFIPACATNPAVETIAETLEKHESVMILENPIAGAGLKTEMLNLLKTDKQKELCEFLWEHRKDFINNNTALDEVEKELWLMLLMQYKDWSDAKIERGLDYFRKYGDIVIDDKTLQTMPK